MAPNTATIETGAAGTTFYTNLAGPGTTFDYKEANASYGTTAATRDTIYNWSAHDLLDLSAFAGAHTLVQSFTASPGNDIVTLTGTAFSVELVGVTTAITNVHL